MLLVVTNVTNAETERVTGPAALRKAGGGGGDGSTQRKCSMWDPNSEQCHHSYCHTNTIPLMKIICSFQHIIAIFLFPVIILFLFIIFSSMYLLIHNTEHSESIQTPAFGNVAV